MPIHLVPFNSDTAEKEYRNLYNQSGNGAIPIFTGVKHQQGYGLGGIFSSLLSAAAPMLKQGAMSLGKTALKTGLNIARDGLAGKNLKQAVKSNLKAAGKDILSSSVTKISNMVKRKQNDQRTNKRKAQRSRSVSVKRSAKRRRRAKTLSRPDIFS